MTNPSAFDARAALTIEVRGLEVYAYHGVPEEERVIGHRYVCDARLGLSECPATTTDDVADSVNYAEVCETLSRVIQTHRDRTVERVVGRLADAILERFPLVAHVEIRLAKRLPPAPYIVDELGVAIRKSR